MPWLRYAGCGAAAFCALLAGGSNAFAARETDGSSPAIQRPTMAGDCEERDMSADCDLGFLRRRLCERGYRVEWLKGEYLPGADETSACLFREQ